MSRDEIMAQGLPGAWARRPWGPGGNAHC